MDLYFEFIQGNVKYKKSSLSVIGQKHIASHRSKSTLSLPELEQTKTKKNNIRLKRIKIIQSNKMDNDC